MRSRSAKLTGTRSDSTATPPDFSVARLKQLKDRARWVQVSFASLFGAMLKLLQIAFDTGEADYDCLRSTAVSVSATSVMLFYVLCSILLVNMLIALMNTKWNDIWSNQTEIYDNLFARQALHSPRIGCPTVLRRPSRTVSCTL